MDGPLRILCSNGKQNKYYRESINAFSLLSSHIPYGIRDNLRTTGIHGQRFSFNSSPEPVEAEGQADPLPV